MGKFVFPNYNTCWHFNDKIAQKYLLDSINAPIPNTHIYYDYESAVEWVEKANYPIVFKLKSGAGAKNVKLVRGKKDARRLCNKAFNGGMSSITEYFSDYQTKIFKTRAKKNYFEKLLRAPKVILNLFRLKNQLPKEKGYILFQEYLPNNSYDTRITIIGNRAFSFIRHNRNNDFRASGSGNIDYDQRKIDLNAVKIAFEISKLIGSQSMAFDLLYDQENQIKIIEISYGFNRNVILNCPGYWDISLNWIGGNFHPEHLIIEDAISSYKSR
jgi:glutathione synthase/RimK-type ligase-like ATP-grasp enzyme